MRLGRRQAGRSIRRKRMGGKYDQDKLSTDMKLYCSTSSCVFEAQVL